MSLSTGASETHWGVGHPSSDPPEPITEVGVTAASSGACTTDTAASGSEALEPWPQPAGAGGLARKGARPLTATLPGSRPAASGCLGPERHLIRGLVLWPPARQNAEAPLCAFHGNTQALRFPSFVKTTS